MSIATGLVVTCLMWGQTAPSSKSYQVLPQPAPLAVYSVPTTKELLPAELTLEQMQALEAVITDLQKAGLTELAQRMQAQLLSHKAHLEQSLGAKRDQVLRLQAEIEALENLLHPKVQVQLELQLWQIDQTLLSQQQAEPCQKLNRLLAQFEEDTLSGLKEVQNISNAEFHELVANARAHNAASKLAAPKVTTLSGMEARVATGKFIPQPIPQPAPVWQPLEHVGTSITMTPTVVNDREIVCAWNLEFSSPKTITGITPAAQDVPAIERRRMSLTTRNRPGEAFIVGQPLQTENDKWIIVFASVELPTATPATP